MDANNLFDAIERNNIELVKTLVSNGANINVIDNSGKSLLHVAAENGSLEHVEFFISKGFEVDLKTQCIEEDEFEWREPNNFFEKVLFSVLKPFIKINKIKKSIGNITPLHLAVKAGNIEIIRFLISKGANVNQKDDDGNTPLHYLKPILWKFNEYSITVGESQILKVLMENGAKVDVANNYFAYPDFFYIEKGDLREIGQILRKASPKRPINCEYSGGTPKFNKLVNTYFKLFNDCLKYDISSKQTDRTSKYTSGDYTYSFKSALKAIEKIAKIRSPIANNMLYLLTKIEDIEVTLNWICDNSGEKGKLSYQPIREKAKKLLKKHKYPHSEPDAFLNIKSYKLRQNIFARIFQIL